MDRITVDEGESQAYCDGWNARGAHEDFTKGNPFPFLSLDYHDWQRGWTDRDEDEWEA